MALKLFNTMGHKIEEFKPIKPGFAGFYGCGPTVYNYAHIGNLRAYVFLDILDKTLTYLGYDIKHVMNITDVGHLTGDNDDGTDKMISYNHYASGAVGDFLYRRIAGIEPEEAGYRRFAVRPLVGGGLTQARGETETPYGRVVSDWKIAEGTFTVSVHVPVGTVCDLTLPDGTCHCLMSGSHIRSCPFVQ